MSVPTTTESDSTSPGTHRANGWSQISTARSRDWSSAYTRALPPPDWSTPNGPTDTSSPRPPAPRSFTTCQAVTNTPGTTWKHVPTASPASSRTRPRYPSTSVGRVIGQRHRKRGTGGALDHQHRSFHRHAQPELDLHLPRPPRRLLTKLDRLRHRRGHSHIHVLHSLVLCHPHTRRRLTFPRTN